MDSISEEEKRRLVEKVRLVEIEKLYPHEQTVEELLNDTFLEIKRDKHIESPIVVDKNTFVVLDGMHRLKILKKKLNCQYVPAFLVDYDEAIRTGEITIERWYRVIRRKHVRPKPCGIGDILSLIKGRGFEIERVHSEEASKLVDQAKAITALVVPTQMYPIIKFKRNKPPRDLRAHYAEVDRIFKLIRQFCKIKKPDYDPEAKAVESVRKGENITALMVPHVKSEDVVEIALNAQDEDMKMFAPKTTRHIVQGRPLYIDITLNELKLSEKTLEEKNKKLAERLLQGAWKPVEGSKKEPYENYRGRSYEERVYIVFPQLVPKRLGEVT